MGLALPGTFLLNPDPVIRALCFARDARDLHA